MGGDNFIIVKGDPVRDLLSHTIHLTSTLFSWSQKPFQILHGKYNKWAQHLCTRVTGPFIHYQGSTYSFVFHLPYRTSVLRILLAPLTKPLALKKSVNCFVTLMHCTYMMLLDNSFIWPTINDKNKEYVFYQKHLLWGINDCDSFIWLCKLSHLTRCSNTNCTLSHT